MQKSFYTCNQLPLNWHELPLAFFWVGLGRLSISRIRLDWRWEVYCAPVGGGVSSGEAASADCLYIANARSLN